MYVCVCVSAAQGTLLCIYPIALRYRLLLLQSTASLPGCQAENNQSFLFNPAKISICKVSFCRLISFSICCAVVVRYMKKIDTSLLKLSFVLVIPALRHLIGHATSANGTTLVSGSHDRYFFIGGAGARGKATKWPFLRVLANKSLLTHEMCAWSSQPCPMTRQPIP